MQSASLQPPRVKPEVTLTRAAREFYDPIIDQLIAIRHQKGMTQDELGALIGCADRYVNKWEARMRYPSSAFLVLWAQALGVTLTVQIPITKGEP